MEKTTPVKEYGPGEFVHARSQAQQAKNALEDLVKASAVIDAALAAHGKLQSVQLQVDAETERLDQLKEEYAVLRLKSAADEAAAKAALTEIARVALAAQKEKDAEWAGAKELALLELNRLAEERRKTVDEWKTQKAELEKQLADLAKEKNGLEAAIAALRKRFS